MAYACARRVITHIVEGGVALCGVAELIVCGRAVDHVIVGDLTAVGAPLGVQSHFCGAHLSALGGDEDDAVGATRAVKCRCGCVLKDCHGGDVAGVEGCDVAVVRHAVEHVERSHARVDGADTADTHCRTYARLAVGVKGLHACYGAIESVGHIGHKTVFKGLSVYHRCGAGVFGFLGCAVSYDHQVVKFTGVTVKSDSDVFSDRNFLSEHSDVGNHELGSVCRDILDDEVSVKIG